ncbi:DNA helicase [Pseudomonas phage Deifobo]|nr:DNA helicase [Pseudomonas phage Deifobo]
MAKDCKLVIKDEVNIAFTGLDVNTRRKLSDSLKFFLPHARHQPAYKLGRWDGCIRYCDIAGRSYLNFLDILIPIVENSGYYITIEDNRQPFSCNFEPIDANSYSHLTWPAGHQYEGQNIVLRDYQVEAVNNYLANTQSIATLPTGFGKTLVTAALAHKVEKYGRTITIVPSKDLVTQTERDFKNFGLDTGVYFGDRKELGKTHTIVTWQSIEAIYKQSKADENALTLEEFIEGVVAVVVDEAHTIKGQSLKEHLTSTFANVPIRWAMTGTIPEEEHAAAALIACIGPVTKTVKAKELQEAGILSELHIEVLQLNDYHTSHPNYAAELKFLTTDPTRLKWLAEHIKSQEGNTLVLVDRLSSGEELLKHIPNAAFVKGDLKSKDRRTEYKSVTSDTDKIIIATFGVASTGIDIPYIHNVYLLEPGKSFIRVIQSIGRGLRKAPGKDYVSVFDITSVAKYSARHLTKRKKFYKEAEYPFSVKKIDY